MAIHVNVDVVAGPAGTVMDSVVAEEVGEVTVPDVLDHAYENVPEPPWTKHVYKELV